MELREPQEEKVSVQAGVATGTGKSLTQAARGKLEGNQNKRRARSWPRDHNTARQAREPGDRGTTLPRRSGLRPPGRSPLVH